MSHFAKIVDGVVEQIIVADSQEWCQTNLGGEWVETSYTNEFRGVYAAIGYSYNIKEDIFIMPQPYLSWIRNGSIWEPPTPMPKDDKFYRWDEATLSWLEITE